MKKLVFIVRDDADLWLREHAGKELHLSVGDGCGGGTAIFLSLEEVRKIRNEMSQWIVIQEAKRSKPT